MLVWLPPGSHMLSINSTYRSLKRGYPVLYPRICLDGLETVHAPSEASPRATASPKADAGPTARTSAPAVVVRFLAATATGASGTSPVRALRCSRFVAARMSRRLGASFGGIRVTRTGFPFRTVDSVAGDRKIGWRSCATS